MTQQPKQNAPARPSIGNPITRAHAKWKKGFVFEAGAGTRTILVDGNSKEAPSPVEALLCCVATCAGTDVVDILEKQRTPLSRMEIEVIATRRAEHPRRVQALELAFTIDGDRIERPQAERALALSIEKYCSVAASLAGDIAITSTIVLNGQAGEPVSQPNFNRAR